MPTLRQKKLAEELAQNELREAPLDMKTMLVKVGYSENTATAKPSEIINSEVVQEMVDDLKDSMKAALDRVGVSPSKIARKINKLLENEDNYKAVASGVDFALKIGVGGGYAPEKSVNLNVKADVKDMSKHESLREEYEAKLKQSLLEE